ncbi:hypothetical protein [Neotamlana laminarinivorans]|uniref:Endosialidase-like protein n=1 Tax=Neotamlana laminarinivorans TaxID=2883124 RepID=A0A9X1L0A4_9FLAO|nr:hypothetical protein [Tamlana laminarinivorans]MCB4797235.1 hypothetical protein [Tamlana laminarinivorans]
MKNLVSILFLIFTCLTFGQAITDTGTKVGIGTDSPLSALQLGNTGANSENYITFGKRISTIETNLPFIGHDSFVDRNDLGLGTRSTAGAINFYTGNSTAFDSSKIRMRILSNGNIGIGTALSNNPNNYKLAVKGTIGAQEVKVENSSLTWSDFVFHDNYNLPTLKEVEQHIKEKGHLKDIPSAKDVEQNGIFLGEMDAKLLQKIEELTLYIIEQEKRIKKIEVKNKRLEIQNQNLSVLLKRLEILEDKIINN